MRMIDTGLIDVLMFSINAAFDVVPKDLTLEITIDNLAFREVEEYCAVDETGCVSIVSVKEQASPSPS